MSEQDMTYIKPLNQKHAGLINVARGLAAAINVLNEAEEVFKRLPGFNSAKLLIEQTETQLRSELAGDNLRAAVRAGFDITTHWVGLIGAGKLFVKPMDLDELAGRASDEAEANKDG